MIITNYDNIECGEDLQPLIGILKLKLLWHIIISIVLDNSDFIH